MQRFNNRFTSLRKYTKRNTKKLRAKLDGSEKTSFNSRKRKRLNQIFRFALLAVTVGSLYYYRIPLKSLILRITSKLFTTPSVGSSFTHMAEDPNSNKLTHYRWVIGMLGYLCTITTIILIQSLNSSKLEPSPVPIKSTRVVTTEPTTHPLLIAISMFISMSVALEKFYNEIWVE
jgi:hypothetical protein